MSEGESSASASEAKRDQGQIMQGLECHGEESDFVQKEVTEGFQTSKGLGLTSTFKDLFGCV